MNPLITGVRNLPKIEKKGSKPGSRKLSKDGGASGGSDAAAGVAAASEDTEVKNFIEPAMVFFSLGIFALSSPYKELLSVDLVHLRGRYLCSSVTSFIYFNSKGCMR